MPEQEPSGGGDDLHAEPGFVGVGLARMRAVGVGELPQSLQQLPAVVVAEMAGPDDMGDRWPSLVSARLARVASVVFGQARDQVLKGCPEVAIGRFVLMV